MSKHFEARVARLASNLYLLRLEDRETRFFEALWEIPEGVTYNAYLLDTGEGMILLDGWKKGYDDLFMEALRSVADPRDVEWVIVHHVEPDHTGTLPRLLEEAGGPTVLCHPMAVGLIEALYGVKPRARVVRDGETLVLGQEELELHYTPWLHWPETIMSYHRGLRVLFSGDAFGSYSIPGGITDEDLDPADVLGFSRKYVATVVGKYRQHVVKVLEKLSSRGVEPQVIAPLHGLVWKKRPRLILDKYLAWAQAEPVKGKVLIAYGSMYGAVEEAINIVSRRLEELGASITVYRFTDRERAPIGALLGDALDAEALVLGAATYESGVFPLIRYVAEELAEKAAASKPVLVVTSYGWGGAAGRRLSEILGRAGFQVHVVEFRGSPGPIRGRLLEAADRLLSGDLG